MKSRAPLALMEQMVMLLVFAVAAALCMQAFVKSDEISLKSRGKSGASLAAQNIAETIRHSGKSPQSAFEEAANLLGGSYEEVREVPDGSYEEVREVPDGNDEKAENVPGGSHEQTADKVCGRLTFFYDENWNAAQENYAYFLTLEQAPDSEKGVWKALIRAFAVPDMRNGQEYDGFADKGRPVSFADEKEQQELLFELEFSWLKEGVYEERG